MTGLAVNFIPRMLFALFEEWGWRGFLEPNLAALGIPDLKRHLIVGLIWSVWHFPWILSTDYTRVSYAVFLPLFTIGAMLAAIVYGQLRKVSQTVWTSVIMHGVGNVFAWVIIQGKLINFSDKILANITQESVLMILLWGALGLISPRILQNLGL